MLITEEYRALQVQMHDEKIYGKSGGKWWGDVCDLIDAYKCKSWLDYGCGTGKLAKFVRNRAHQRNIDPPLIREYDPGIRGKDVRLDGRYDLVTCLDVLEHVEMECLAEVLKDLRNRTGKLLFTVISTRLAGKKLPDGRNAHLIVMPDHWWLIQLHDAGFKVKRTWYVRPDEICVICDP